MNLSVLADTRTGVWFFQQAGNCGHNHEYTPEQKEEFHQSSEHLVSHAKDIENQINNIWGTHFQNSDMQAKKQVEVRAKLAEMIQDKRLLEGFTPSWPIGWRRITPGDPYMR